MATDIESLKANLKHWTLLLGVLQITIGCLIGFIPPPHGVDSPVVTGLLQLCGATILIALLFTLYELLRSRSE